MAQATAIRRQTEQEAQSKVSLSHTQWLIEDALAPPHQCPLATGSDNASNIGARTSMLDGICMHTLLHASIYIDLGTRHAATVP